MNIKLYDISSLGLLVLLLFSSCKKWTEVQPTIEVRGDLIFSNEATIQEALNGVYSSMTKTNGYGRHLTWGFVDAMGGIYTPGRLESFEAEAATGKFDNTLTEGVIEQLWNNTYNALANDNYFIENIDKANNSIFTGNNKNLMKGEALGIRAMLHFDMLRLFGPSVNSTAWNSPILPYVTKYTSNITNRSTGPEIIAKLHADLAEAEELLKTDLIVGTVTLNELRTRKVRFNYYAVKALQARLYLWSGDKPKALAAAKVIIDAAPQKFPWTGANGILSLTTLFDYILSSENVFSLYVSNLGQYVNEKLVNIPLSGAVNQDFAPHYGLTETMRQEVYEATGTGITDYRNIYMIGGASSQISTTLLFKKLNQNEGANQPRPQIYAENRIPLIKVSEMFYVAAECLADIDPTEAINYLNTVRTNRGISVPLASMLTAAQINQEIRKEYRKEFACEGQFFYYKKRTGEINYVLPLPQRELEYGL